MSSVFKKYIKSVDNSRIEFYDSLAPSDDNDWLMGTRDKTFIRCSSEFFYDLFDEIKNNPNCGYETYINDLVVDNCTPKYLSIMRRKDNDIMIRHDNTGLGHFKDVCASRILNFFECPTVYETILNVFGEDCCCSVDFNKCGEDFFPLSCLIGLGDSLVKENLKMLEVMLNNFHTIRSFNNFEGAKEKFLEEYIYSFLVRRYVLSDSDCWFNNFGIIVNNDSNTFRFAPNFDFEYSFSLINGVFKKGLFQSSFEYDLDFLKNKYPHIYTKFCNKFNDFISRKESKPIYEQIFEKEVGNNGFVTEFLEEYNWHLNGLNDIICPAIEKERD